MLKRPRFLHGNGTALARSKKLNLREKFHFWLLAAFLILVFLMGGGSRPDIQSLVILRPLAVVTCGVALFGMKLEEMHRFKPLLIFFGCAFVLVIANLIPLPYAVWSALPGRDLVADIDKAASIGKIWRPLGMVPWAAWNALYSMFVPLAVLLLCMRVTYEQMFDLLKVVIALGLASGLLGILQSIGDPAGPLYFYRVTNNGTAVGLFANRNHQAVLLATIFPMLAVTASAGAKSDERARFQASIAIAVAIVLVPLLLVTGSRAGLALGGVGLAVAALLYKRPEVTVAPKRKVVRFNIPYIVAGLGVIALVAVTALASRASALQRLLEPGDEDLRFRMWGPIAEMAGRYFPFGSGVGSFVEIYLLDEPSSLLRQSYVNHAHNDYLEIYLTMGLPGLLLLSWLVLLCLREGLASLVVKQKLGRTLMYKRLGFVVVVMFGIASFADYPLRTPALSSVFVLALVWLFGRDKNAADCSGSPA